MKHKKRMSEKAIEANRRNGSLSRGPRTKEGKTARNAIKTGFFSRGLYVAEADRETFERLRTGIEEQLRPTTVLQRLYADAVIDAAWRCKQASQLDAQHLNHKLFEPGAEGIPAPAEPTITEWYGSNPRAMRDAIWFIEILIPRVRNGARLPADAAEDVKRAFGEEFLRALTEWESSEFDHLVVAHNMIEKAKLFDLDLKHLMTNGEDENDEGQKQDRNDVPKTEHVLPKIVKDPLERADMMVKLLEQKKQHLVEMQHILKHVDGNIEGQHLSEPPCRYLSWAFHQLERTLKSYRRLRGAGW